MESNKTFYWGGQVVKAFTDEQITELSSNRYVEYISRTTISFTMEFKQLFYEQKQQGKALRQILSEHGINPEYLGEKRIISLSGRINKMAVRTDGFKDLRANNKRQVSIPKDTSIEARISRLESKVAYLEAENEFLKKIRDADRQAQKEHRLKQKHVQNIK